MTVPFIHGFSETEFFTFHLPSLAFFIAKWKSKFPDSNIGRNIGIGKIITFGKLKIASKIFWKIAIMP